MKLFIVLGLLCIAGSLSIRLLDPLVPLVARDLDVTIYQAVTISSAYALPYALSQPLMGPFGDAFSKARIVHFCLGLMLVSIVVCALAPNFAILFIGRVIGGLAGGGSIPLALSILADRVPVEERQVAISRLMFAAVLGQLGGSVASGSIGERFGWRAPFALAALVTLVALAACLWGLRPRRGAPRGAFSLARARAGYVDIFANPRAVFCYGCVMSEGVLIFGLFPHLAGRLEATGAGGAHEAGYVIGVFALGGVAYAAIVPTLLRRYSQFTLMRLGALCVAAGLTTTAYAAAWPIFAGALFLAGVGFYLLHGPLQVQATELAPHARGSAVGLHAFSFFMGSALGPIVYSWGFQAIGYRATQVGAAIAMTIVAFLVTSMLSRLSPG